MGLFAAITGLFKRSSDSTKEDQTDVSISGNISSVDTSATSITTPVFTSSTSSSTDTFTIATDSTNIDYISIDTSSTSMEEGCACGGSCACQGEPEEAVCACDGLCTCKEEPEQEVVDESTYDFHSEAPPTTQATFPGMDDLPIDTKPEIEPPIKVRKIEDASTIILPTKKVKQLQLPGFEDVPIIPSKAKKRSNAQKSSAKLVRKSTAKRKK